MISYVCPRILKEKGTREIILGTGVGEKVNFMMKKEKIILGMGVALRMLYGSALASHYFT